MLSIYIQPHITQWRPGSRLIKELDIDDKEFNDYILGKFAKKIAKIYVEELVSAINTERYKSRWEPLSVDYLTWKKNNGLSEKIWEASSLLKDSISTWKYKDYYVVGVKQNVRYPDSKVPVYKVIRLLEFGSSKMPPRPLFLPVKKLINSRLRTYWEEFIDEEFEDYEEDVYDFFDL